MRFVANRVALVCVALAACGGSATPPGSTSPGSSGGKTTSSGSAGGASGGTSGGVTGGSNTGGAAPSGSSSTGSGTSTSSTGGNAGPVIFTVDVALGPLRQFQPPAGPAKVSPYVYGINGFGFSGQATRWGLLRQGGNAFTPWNWSNNHSNSGSDYCFWEGPESGGTAVAGALTQVTDSISAAQGKGEAYLATVPILDHVAASFSNNVYDGSPVGNCPGPAVTCGSDTASSYDLDTGSLDFASTDPLSLAFVANAPTKGSSYCTCPPGQVCAGQCNIDALGPVYQDEFANFMKVNYGAGGTPLFFELDNEPNYWGGTHPELWPFTGQLPCQQASVSYDQILGRDIDYAIGIKTGWAQALVFGPVVAQDGLIYAHSYSADPHYPTEFLDYYLQQMQDAGASYGAPLLDALDVHYYSNNAGTAQCLQNPRLLWDPSYTDLSAADTDSIDFGWAGLDNYFDTEWYPRQIVPRLERKIAAAYPASGGLPAPGLAFSEYNSGCESQIEGGVAEADDLGVFGREGMFAATAWPLASLTDNYLVAAFDLYRNYDGQGSVVGDTAVRATTTNATDTSVYAFTHSDDATAVDLVAINKTGVPVTVALQIANAPALTTVAAYELVGAQAAVVAAQQAPGISCSDGTCSINYSLPATSATTLILR